MFKPKAKSKVLVDYKKKDYRGFIFVVHDEHGMMLLRCTRKKSKPPHWQLPGGHVDEEEFVSAAELSNDPDQQLLIAAKTGAARELYEETGMDMLRELDRLQPAQLGGAGDSQTLPNLYKSRLFFFLPVTDQDFPKNGVSPMGQIGKHLTLKLSVEHSGFIFQPEPDVAAEMLVHHSGGKCAEALRMAQQSNGSPPKGGGGQSGAATTASAPATTKEATTSVERSTPFDLPPPPKKDGWWCCFG